MCRSSQDAIVRWTLGSTRVSLVPTLGVPVRRETDAMMERSLFFRRGNGHRRGGFSNVDGEMLSWPFGQLLPEARG